MLKDLVSFVGWNQMIMVFTALVTLWYVFGAGKLLLQGKSKLGEALRTVGLGLAWPSIWAIYNPHDFAALIPFLTKGLFALGAIGFVVGMVMSAKVNFKGFKRTPKSASPFVQTD